MLMLPESGTEQKCEVYQGKAGPNISNRSGDGTTQKRQKRAAGTTFLVHFPPVKISIAMSQQKNDATATPKAT